MPGSSRRDRLLRTAQLAGAVLLLHGCATEPEPMPTAQAVADAGVTADTQPPLYQLLYETPLLPAPSAEQQRVRMLIWVRRMAFSDAQLARLEGLRALVIERTEQIARAEREVAERYAPEEQEIYEALWERLGSGAPADAPEVVALTERLAKLQRGSERERDLLRIRIEGIRDVLQAEEGFLHTLSPGQEALLAESTFFLRHRLDPVGNPESFRALVGSTYEPGQYAVLVRGTTRWAREPLNIGGLWSDEPPLAGGALHEAQRDVLLYLALLEPGMDEALEAAREMLALELELSLGADLDADTGTAEQPDSPAEGEAAARGEEAGEEPGEPPTGQEPTPGQEPPPQ